MFAFRCIGGLTFERVISDHAQASAKLVRITLLARTPSAQNSRFPIAPVKLDRKRSEEELDGRGTIERLAETGLCAQVAPVPTRHRRTSRKGSGRTRSPPGGQSERSGPDPTFCGRSANSPARNTLPPDAACGVRRKGVLFANPECPSFRHIVSRGTIAPVAPRPVQLLRIMVPGPYRLARMRSVGKIQAAALPGIRTRTRSAACRGSRPRDSHATARTPVRPDRTGARMRH